MGLFQVAAVGCLVLVLQGTYADVTQDTLLNMTDIEEQVYPHINVAYKKPCYSSKDCGNQTNMFCDPMSSVCRCLPNTAYDRFGKECRVYMCSNNYYSNGEYKPNCPEGYTCQNSKCTSYCTINDHGCNPTPSSVYRYDSTFEIAFFCVLGVLVVFFGVLILTCIWRRCKRLRCKRVCTQHGQTVLIADSNEPLIGTEKPTKVFSLCFCVPPVTTTTPYLTTAAPSAMQTTYDVKHSQMEYKELPPTYFGPPITDEPIVSVSTGDSN